MSQLPMTMTASAATTGATRLPVDVVLGTYAAPPGSSRRATVSSGSPSQQWAQDREPEVLPFVPDAGAGDGPSSLTYLLRRLPASPTSFQAAPGSPWATALTSASSTPVNTSASPIGVLDETGLWFLASSEFPPPG